MDAPANAAPSRAAAIPLVITPEEWDRMAEDQDEVLLLDVRTPAEFADGHIAGARNLSHDQVASRLDELTDYRDKPVVVYCRSGRRASMVESLLIEKGFEQVYHLAGDMIGWKQDNRPVQKGPAP